MHLANGDTVVVDHVIVTSGHTANQDLDNSREVEPVPRYSVRGHDSDRREGRRVRDGIGGGRRRDGADDWPGR